MVVEALATGERTVLVERGWEGRYLRTGHLVYMLGGTLFAQPMDLASLATRGTATPVIEGIETAIASASFSISASGTLAYLTGANLADARTLVWVTRNGEELGLGLEPLLYNNPRVSPDGSAIAVEVQAGGRTNVRVYDLRRRTLRHITFGAERDYNPLWAPDGNSIVFGSTRQGGGLFRKSADGTGEVERLQDGLTLSRPYSWSPNGDRLIYSFGGDLVALSLQGEEPPQALLETPDREAHPEVSPDGRWLAYTSDESGELNVYVRPFPDLESGLWPVSTGGGLEPVWSSNGRELFYRSGVAIKVVTVGTGDGFRMGTPRTLFTGPYLDLGAGRQYDAAPDGKRFLMLKAAPADDRSRRVVVVQNWFEELKRLVPN